METTRRKLNPEDYKINCFLCRIKGFEQEFDGDKIK